MHIIIGDMQPCFMEVEYTTVAHLSLCNFFFLSALSPLHWPTFKLCSGHKSQWTLVHITKLKYSILLFGKDRQEQERKADSLITLIVQDSRVAVLQMISLALTWILML